MLKLTERLVSAEMRAFIGKLYNDDKLRGGFFDMRGPIRPASVIDHLNKLGAFSLTDYIYMKYHYRKMRLVETKIAMLRIVTSADEEPTLMPNYPLASNGVITTSLHAVNQYTNKPKTS